VSSDCNGDLNLLGITRLLLRSFYSNRYLLAASPLYLPVNMTLTTNAISKIFGMSGAPDDPSFTPIVQLIHVKKIDNKSTADDRYRVRFVLSIHMQTFSSMTTTEH
jgi:hypothetical protein